MPHILSPSNNDVVNILNRAFPNVALFIIAILAIFLLMGMWWSKEVKFGQSMRGWVALISFIIIVGIFTYAAGWWTGGQLPDWLNFLNDSGTVALIVIILVFIVIIMYVTGGEEKKEGEERGLSKFIKALGGEEEK
jgi:Na+(H+)/acetate symporter ActP